MLAVSAGYVEHVVLLVGLGVCTGLLSGLLGIGGGVIIVPALFAVFSSMGLPQQSLMHYAVGTSLGVMVISASSAVSFHFKHMKPNWFLVAMLCPVVCIGVVLGASLAHSLPTHWLQRLFALLLIIVAYKLFRDKKNVEQGNTVSHLSFKAAGPLGTFVGFCSVYWGLVVVSLRCLFYCINAAYRHAIMTSLLMSVTAAVTGVIVYMIIGHLHAEFRSQVYWQCVCNGALLVAIGATGTWFAKDHGLLSNPIAEKIFACLLLLTCLHMVYSSFH